MTFTEQQREEFVLPCERCGQPAEVEWVDVSTYTSTSFVIGETRCRTPGCFDENGSRRVPLPPQPGGLTRADLAWLAGQQALIDE